VDEEFQRNRTSILAALGLACYQNTARQFREAYEYLASDPPQGAKAIRSMSSPLRACPTNLNKYQDGKQSSLPMSLGQS
jgi:hypothetical protein